MRLMKRRSKKASVASAVARPASRRAPADWGVPGELVAFTAKGRRGKFRRLDGFYRCAKPGSPLLIFVHGMGSNFYRSPLKKAFLEQATAFGFSVLSFDNVGAGSGTEVEHFGDCVADLEAARAFARRRGHRRLVWVGHSTGCQKIAYWQAKCRPAGVAALVLLAPADDHAILQKNLGRRLAAKVAWAKRCVASGRPDEPVPGLYERLGARRFLSVADTARTEANLFRYDGALTYFRRIRCPLLAVFGANEEFSKIPPAEMLSILDQRTRSDDFSAWLVPETGHSFRGEEGNVAERVYRWALERLS